MWTCPKYGRTFKRQEQSHYCGKASETVDEYIAGHPETVRGFSERLKGYKTGKGIIQFPYRGTVQAELVSDIARRCYETENHPQD